MKSTLLLIPLMIIGFSMISCQKTDENKDNDIRQLDSIPTNDTSSQVIICVHDSCNSCNLSEKSQRFYDRLINAYDLNNIDSLKSTFDDWAKEYQDIDIYSLTNDTLKNIYELFYEFYTPRNYFRYTYDSMYFDNCHYCDYNYYLIQKEIKYSFEYKHNYYSREESIKIIDFYPVIKDDEIQLLSFEYGDYSRAISCFLGPIDINESRNPLFPMDETLRRKDFINECVSIAIGHWHDWKYYTYPLIDNIAFNIHMDSARVSFGLGSSGWECIMSKNNNVWKIDTSYHTWQE